MSRNVSKGAVVDLSQYRRYEQFFDQKKRRMSDVLNFVTAGFVSGDVKIPIPVDNHGKLIFPAALRDIPVDSYIRRSLALPGTSIPDIQFSGLWALAVGSLMFYAKHEDFLFRPIDSGAESWRLGEGTAIYAWPLLYSGLGRCDRIVLCQPARLRDHVELKERRVEIEIGPFGLKTIWVGAVFNVVHVKGAILSSRCCFESIPQLQNDDDDPEEIPNAAISLKRDTRLYIPRSVAAKRALLDDETPVEDVRLELHRKFKLPHERCSRVHTDFEGRMWIVFEMGNSAPLHKQILDVFEISLESF